MSDTEKLTHESLISKLKKSNGPYTPTDMADAFFSQTSLAKILEVNGTTIRYLDNDGNNKTISIDECKCSADSPSKEYAGMRSMHSSPPWVRFFDIAETRFEFQYTSDARAFVYNELGPVGVKTIDMD